MCIRIFRGFVLPPWRQLEPWVVELRKIEELSRLRDVDGLIEELGNQTPGEGLPVRAHAARALGRVGDRRALDALANVLATDPDDSVRSTAARALADVADRGAIPALATAASTDDSPIVRQWSVKSLVELGASEAIPSLIGFLASDEWYVRRWASRLLATVGDKTALQPLEALAESERSILRRRHVRRAFRAVQRRSLRTASLGDHP